MAVRLLLSSGRERTVDAADSARLDGPFFLVRRWYPDLNRTETVLTLLSRDVIAAEVLKDGLRIDYVAGSGPTKVAKELSAMDAPPRFVPDAERSPGTLGAVLYASPPKAFVSEAEWVALVRSVAEGDQSALHALYDRAHRAVFTFVMRITADVESAEDVTLEVFHGVWRRASRYRAADGTVLGWIMNQAHSRAMERRRFDDRQNRVGSDAGDPFSATGPARSDGLIAFKQQSQTLGNALIVLTPDERTAIEAAFFSELTFAEVAARLNEPLGTIKTRVQSGLHKLREALTEGGHRA
jgi:RNA polymerase sigma-70 factor (ECF subfamily)